MAKNYSRCPFLKTRCKECPIYRGRHCYVEGQHGEQAKPVRAKKDEQDWSAGFIDFFDALNEGFRKSIRTFGWEEPDEPER